MFEQVIKRCDDLIKVYQGKKTEIEQAVTKAISDLRASDTAFRNSFSGIFGVHKGQVTVGGRADTYYPVVFKAPYDGVRIGSSSEFTHNMIHTLEVTRYYSQTPKPVAGNSEVPYNGAHWLSMQFKMEFTGIGWDGGPDHNRIIKHRYNYRRGVGAVRALSRDSYSVVLWLRGGGTVYNWSSSYDLDPYVLCEDGSEMFMSSRNEAAYGRIETRVSPVTDAELTELESFVSSASTASFPNWSVNSASEWAFRNHTKNVLGRPLQGIGDYDAFIANAKDPSQSGDALSYFGTRNNVQVADQKVSASYSKKDDNGSGEYNWGVWLRSRFCRWYMQKDFTEIADLASNKNYRFDNTKYTRMTPTNPNGDVGVT